MHEKQTIYFLEWLHENYNVDINRWLDNCKEDNVNWYIAGFLNQYTFNEIIIRPSTYAASFLWDEALDKTLPYSKIHTEWVMLVHSGKYNIEYSKYPIINFKRVNIDEPDLKFK